MGATLCCAALTLAAGGVFTVDDDGPADFTSIVAAVASPAVGDGDVLIVQPGSYGAFALTKALDVVAATEGEVRVDGTSSVVGVERFALVGLTLRELLVEGVPGRSRLEGVTIGGYGLADGLPSYWVGLLEVVDCEALVVSRTTAHGVDACYPEGPDDAGPAVRVDRSAVVFVDCAFQGGQGTGFGEACNEHYPTAGAGLLLEGGSRVLVSGSTLRGGHGPFQTSRPAIAVQDSAVEVRGTGEDELAAALPAQAFEVAGASHVTVSGVTLASLGLPPEVVLLAEPRPSLRRRGEVGPGATFTAELFGPAGGTALLAVALDGGPAALGSDPVPLLLDPSGVLALVPLVTAGPDLPATYGAVLPGDPALVGLRLALQALVTAPGATGPLLTGPVDLTLRP